MKDCLIINSTETAIGERSQTLHHRLDRVDVLADSSKGRLERIVHIVSSGGALIRSNLLTDEETCSFISKNERMVRNNEFNVSTLRISILHTSNRLYNKEK